MRNGKVKTQHKIVQLVYLFCKGLSFKNTLRNANIMVCLKFRNVQCSTHTRLRSAIRSNATYCRMPSISHSMIGTYSTIAIVEISDPNHVLSCYL